VDKFYKILGLNPGATKEDIRKAFKEKAVEFHPDKIGGNTEKFKEINKAYGILTGKQKLNRHEIQEQEREKQRQQQRQQISYYNPYRYKPFKETKESFRSRKRYEYWEEQWIECSACQGRGGYGTICKKCFGTLNVVVPPIKDTASKIYVCKECNRGYESYSSCRICEGSGRIFKGKIKRSYWK